VFYIVVLLLGASTGALGSWVVAARRGAAVTRERDHFRGVIAQREGQLSGLSDTLTRERSERDGQMASMMAAFDQSASRVLHATASELAQGQENSLRNRDERIATLLRPLEGLLSEYRTAVVSLSNDSAGALAAVSGQAAALLLAQESSMRETSRLNALLGRGDQRGRWGEVQLTNVLEASGLRKGIDYTVQVSTRGAAGLLRPDCVVRVGGACMAIDAKFPFDAFETALGATSESEKRDSYTRHASALRAHVRSLGDKAYWSALSPSPEFVICFVPSDAAIAAALESDGDLHAFAARSRVLLAGPTSLLATLWSVAMVVANNEAALNAHEILKAAETMLDRLRLVLEPVVRMGQSLGVAVSSYNQMVHSVESRLAPVARRMRASGAGRQAKGMPALLALEESVVAASVERWGHDAPSLFSGEESTANTYAGYEE
jgi:DNA recombination protein RmuC